MSQGGPGTVVWLHQTHQALRLIWRTIAARPFTFILAATILLAAVSTGSVTWMRSGVRLFTGTGYEPLVEQGHWWSPITALFLTSGTVELIIVLILVVVLVGVSEGLMGAWKSAVAFFATGLGGTIFGIGLQAFGSSRGEFWSHNVSELVAFVASGAIAGTLMTASAFASVLWRRRIRVLTLLVCIVLLLYSGLPSDLYRIISAFLGLALGYAYRPAIRMLAWARSSHHEIRVLLSTVIAITAIGPAIAIFSPSRFGPLAPIGLLLGTDVPKAGDVIDRCQVLDVTRGCVRDIALERINGLGPILVSIIPLLLLLVVAWGLLRGRRFAVWLGAIVNGLLAVLAAVYFGFLPIAGQIPRHPNGHYWEVILALTASVLMPLTVAILLLALRRHFQVRASRRVVSRYLATVGLSGIGLAALYVGVGWLLRDTGFNRGVTLADLLADVTERFIPVAFLHREMFDFFPTTPLGSILYHGVGPVFWGIIVIGAIAPMLGNPAGGATRGAARARVLMQKGGDAISFMTTWPGNSYWFDPVEEAAIAYRVIGGVAVTTGGPIGPVADPSGPIVRFARFCDDRGWLPTFYSVEETHRRLFAGMGWATMVVAEETVIRPGEWNMKGKRWQDVRSSINRAQRAGIRAEWTATAAVTIGTAAQIAEISELWIAEKDLPEMGFTLGGIDELQDPAVRLMLAIDDDGVVHGVSSWLPTYRDGIVIGWTLDFMRRRPGSINGVMEFLIAETANRMHERGLEFMSLSAAPLAHTADAARGSAGDSSSMDRLLGFLSSSLEPVYGFRSLLSFKKKFQPELRPLLLAYPDPVALPRIGYALLRAYLPGLSVRQVARLLRGPA